MTYDPFQPSRWHLAHGRDLELGPRGVLMAIINVTPDSFSDGGRFADPDAAVRAALRALEAGAEILDIGGESTRPDAKP
ncbi:dihydropteroate synthase, partial [Sinorhizobium meliloti]